MIDTFDDSSSGDLKPFSFQDRPTLKPGVHSSEEEESQRCKNVEDCNTNKPGQLVKGADREYDCKVTSDYDQGFVEKPALMVISLNLGEAEAPLLERETNKMDVASIFGEVLDIKGNYKISLNDFELKSVEAQDKGKICAVQNEEKRWEVVGKGNGLKKKSEITRDTKKTYSDSDDSGESEDEEEEDFEQDSLPDCSVAFCFIFVLSYLLLSFLATDGKGLKPTCVVKMPSQGCIEDDWYRIDENKTKTKVCEGMVCRDSYMKEKNCYDTCSLVFPFTKGKNVTFWNTIELQEFGELSKFCPEVILEGKYGNKEGRLTDFPGFDDFIKSCLDDYQKRLSAHLSCGEKDSSATRVVLIIAVSGIIAILINFASKLYCKSRKDTMVEPLLAKNKELLSSVTVV